MPFFMDTITQFYPVRMLVADEIRSFHLPLWNPYIYSGVPLLANPQWATFYPLNILFYLFPTPFIFTFLIIIHISIAGLGTFLYVKYITKSNIPALLSGLSIIFSSYYISHIALIPHLYASAYIPFILLFVEIQIEKRDRRLTSVPLFLLGITLAIQLLSGSPQISYYSLMIAILYYMIRTVQDVVRDLSRINLQHKCRPTTYIFNLLTFISVTLIIFIGLSAVQLIPGVELSSQCERVSKLPLDTIKSSALNLGGMLKSFLGGTGLPEDTDTINYFGFCNLLLIIIGLFLVPNRYFTTFIIISLFAIIYSLNLLVPFLYKIFPFYAKFHAPRRILVLLTFSGSIMAGLGLDNLIKLLFKIPIVGNGFKPFPTNEENVRDAYMRPPQIKLTIIKVISIFIFLISIPFIIRLFLIPETKIIFTNGIPYNFFILISFAVFFIILVWILLNKEDRRYTSVPFMLLIIIISVFDLILFSSRLEKTFISPNKLFDKNKVIKTLKQDEEPFRFFSFDFRNSYSYDFRQDNFSSYLFPNVGTFYKLSDTQGYDPLIPKRYSEFFKVLNDGFVSIYPSHFTLIRNPSSPLLDILNIKYAIGDMHWYHPFFIQFKLSNNSTRLPIEKVEKASKVEFVTVLNNAMDIRDNVEVCNITIKSIDGKTVKYMLKAGLDTADWRIDNPLTYLKFKHSKAKFKKKWFIKENNVFFPTYDFYTTFDLPENFVPNVIEFRGRLEKAEIAFIDIRFLLQDRIDKFTLVKESNEIPIYKNNNFLPRVFPISKILPSANNDESLSLLKKMDIDFSSTAIVEGWDKSVLEFDSSSTQTTVSHAELVSASNEIPKQVRNDIATTILKQNKNPNVITIRYKSEKENFVVLSVPFFNGWNAKIDGGKTRVYITDHILQGIYVPKGEHTLTFYYSPNSFFIGLSITILSLIIIGYLLIKKGCQSKS